MFIQLKGSFANILSKLSHLCHSHHSIKIFWCEHFIITKGPLTRFLSSLLLTDFHCDHIKVKQKKVNKVKVQLIIIYSKQSCVSHPRISRTTVHQSNALWYYTLMIKTSLHLINNLINIHTRCVHVCIC